MENELELWREAEKHWAAALMELDKMEHALNRLGDVGRGLVGLVDMLPVNSVMPFFAACLPAAVRRDVAEREVNRVG